jgi:hypothetical protein
LIVCKPVNYNRMSIYFARGWRDFSLPRGFLSPNSDPADSARVPRFTRFFTGVQSFASTVSFSLLNTWIAANGGHHRSLLHFHAQALSFSYVWDQLQDPLVLCQVSNQSQFMSFSTAPY